MEISVDRRHALAEVETEWAELKQRITKGYYDPSLEIDVLKGIYEIISPSFAKFEILVVKEKNAGTIAILPFYVLNNPCLLNYKEFEKDFDHMLLGEGIPSHFHPMIDMDYIDVLEPYFISYLSYEWSFDITHPKIKHFKEFDGIELSDLETYLESLVSKDKKEFGRLLRKNSDIIVKKSTKSITDPAYTALLDGYKMYRASRESKDQEIFPAWMKDFTSSDVYLKENYIILDNAEKNNQLHTLEFWLGTRLVGVNFAIRVGPTMTDYLTLRDMSDDLRSRSIGIYAILKNIEHAYLVGCTNYDLGTPHFTKNFDYKKKFFNKKFKIPFISNVSDLLLYNYIKNNYDEYPILYRSAYIYDKQETLRVINKMSSKKLKQLKEISSRCGLNSDILVSEA
jgi:hypothetical protein